MGTQTLEKTTVDSVLRHAQKRIFKIIVIGDSNVGKTCLTYRFCGGQFAEKTDATIGVDFREKTLDIEGETIKLQIWDTAGQERFRRSMVQHYYRNVHAVVFVYDVAQVSSFENLSGWIEECRRHHLTETMPRIVVGNKCDLTQSGITTTAVGTALAQRFADSHNMPLFETSAKDDSEAAHVAAIFVTLAHKLKNRKPMMPPGLAGYDYRSVSMSSLSDSGCSGGDLSAVFLSEESSLAARRYRRNQRQRNDDNCLC